MCCVNISSSQTIYQPNKIMISTLLICMVLIELNSLPNHAARVESNDLLCFIYANLHPYMSKICAYN